MASQPPLQVELGRPQNPLVRGPFSHKPKLEQHIGNFIFAFPTTGFTCFCRKIRHTNAESSLNHLIALDFGNPGNPGSCEHRWFAVDFAEFAITFAIHD